MYGAWDDVSLLYFMKITPYNKMLISQKKYTRKKIEDEILDHDIWIKLVTIIVE